MSDATYQFAVAPDPPPVTIDDCGTRSQLMTVETLIAIGVRIELVDAGVGITRPLRVEANGYLIEILPYGRPEHRKERFA